MKFVAPPLVRQCRFLQLLSLGRLHDSLISGIQHSTQRWEHEAALDTVFPSRCWSLDPRDGPEHNRGSSRGSKVHRETYYRGERVGGARVGGASRKWVRRARGGKLFPRGSQVLKDGMEITDQACRGHRQNGNLQLQLLPRQSWLIPKALALYPLDKLQGRLSDTEHPLMRWDEQGQGNELIPLGGVQPSASLSAHEGRGLLKAHDFFFRI